MQLTDHEKVRAGKWTAVVVGVIAIVLGILFEKMNVSFLVGWAFSVAASANLPSLVMLLFWKGTTKQGITAAILVGMTVVAGLDSAQRRHLQGRLRPARQPGPRSVQPAGHRDDSAGLRGADRGVAARRGTNSRSDWPDTEFRKLRGAASSRSIVRDTFLFPGSPKNPGRSGAHFMHLARFDHRQNLPARESGIPRPYATGSAGPISNAQ